MVDLVRYDAMCTAIAECHQIDEVKDLRDKAMALELYAKQARNTDAERRASEIRLRAERRTGELLKELARVEPAARNAAGANQHEVSPKPAEKPQSPYAKALSDTGISTQTASRYQALANVPKATFEEALRDPVVKPTTSRLIEQARAPQPQMPDDALWLWGRARDFERDHFATKNPSLLLDSMTDSMRADMARIVDSMAEFFTAMSEALHERA